MEIFGEIEKWTMTKTKFEAMDLLNKYDIPCGPILSMKELAEEPSLRKTGTVVEVDHPKRGKYLTVGNPIKLSDSPTEVTRSPLLGEHTDEVLDELGYTREQIEALRAEKVIWTAKSKPLLLRRVCFRLNRGQSPTIQQQTRTRKKHMAHDKTTVRNIIDKVKSEGRTSLTAPEGKLVCDAYGIPVPQEGVAKSAAEAAKLAAGMGFPVVLKIVSPEILHKTEAGGVLVGMKSAADVEQGFATIMANAKKYNDKATLARRAGAADAAGRAGSDHRRRDRSVVRQARRFRLGRHPGRGAEGRDVPARTRVEGRRAVDARQHRGGRDAERRARCCSRRSRSARDDDPARVASSSAISRRSASSISIRCSRPTKGAIGRGRADRHRPAAGAGAIPARATTTSCKSMNRIMKPDSVAVIGASAEAGKIGNSVMKNLINGGYQGKLYPIHPKADEIMGHKAYKSVKDVPGDIDVAVFAIPAKFVAQALVEVGEKRHSRCGADPVGLRRDGQRRRAEGDPGRSAASTTCA